MKYFSKAKKKLRHLLALTLMSVSAHAISAVPAAAVKVIYRVHQAAAVRDVSALEKLMVPEFTWSFGGDADAKQALAAWKRRPMAFRKLREVTAKRCILQADGSIECPRGAGTGYRAGFIQTAAGWRMAYFVAGD